MVRQKRRTKTDKSPDLRDGPLSFNSFNNNQGGFKNVCSLKCVWYDHEAFGPHSLQKWFNTFINGKWILFDVPDNGGKDWTRLFWEKDCVIMWQYCTVRPSQLTCVIWSHLFDNQTNLWGLKCDAFEALTKSHQSCQVLKVTKTFGALLTSFGELNS